MSQLKEYKIDIKGYLNCDEIDHFLELKQESDFYHFKIEPDLLTEQRWYCQLIKDLFENYIYEQTILKPIIIISSISRLDFLDEKEKLDKQDRQIRFLKAYSYCSFLFNSSAWIKYVELECINEINGCSDEKYDISASQVNYNTAINHLDRSKPLNIYTNPNAKEYIEYHFRLQEVNYLLDNPSNSMDKAHGRYITPTIYADEQIFRQKIRINDDLKFFFTDDRDEKNVDFKIKGINLRILLIDDKIGVKSNSLTKNNSDLECKAHLIKKLLELKFEFLTEEETKDGKKNMQEKVCWRTPKGDEETVDIFQFQCTQKCCEKCSYVSIIDEERDIDNLKSNLKKREEPHIQIVAASNLRQARQLLAADGLRFDLVLMDYLLDKKDDKPGEREYATEFWGDGDVKYFNLNEGDEKYNQYQNIKSNRGPLQRLWILPITAFNQTFIDDLRIKGVRLIDYYWYLSRGADPINTPYLFIYSLNKFLQLQIESAIFDDGELIAFLKKSIEKIKKIDTKDKDENIKNKFRDLFGSEYVFFISNFATEEQIARDAEQGSLFGLYVKENFFKTHEDLKKLNRSIRRLYHSLAYGEDHELEQCIERWYRVRDRLNFLQKKMNINIDEDKTIVGEIDKLELNEIFNSIKFRFYHG